MTEITLSIEGGDRVNLYHPAFEKKIKKTIVDLDRLLEGDPMDYTADGIMDDFLGALQELGIYFD